MPNNNQQNNVGAELEANFGESNLSLRNAAPGIFFAAFGSLIVVVVLASSPPEFRFDGPNATGAQVAGTNHQDSEPQESTSRARQQDPVSLVLPADSETPETLDALYDASVNYYNKALAYMERAVSISKDQGEHYDLLASLYFGDSQFDDALKTQQKALESASQLADKAAMKRRLAGYKAAVK